MAKAEILDSALDVVHEVGQVTKRTSELRVVGKLVHTNGNIETLKKVLISEAELFVLVPTLNRVWMVDKIYYEDGKKVVYLPMKYHKTLDIDKVTFPTQYNILAKFRYMRKWQTFKIQSVTGSINLNAMDNDLSPDLIADSHKILKTKALEFLEEVPKRVWMLSIIISALIGIIVGGIGMIIALGIL